MRLIVLVELVLVSVLLWICNGTVDAQLQTGFYSSSCIQAEGIVKQAVSKAFWQNPGVAAGLIRMHFHDCFVNGCDGSILLDSTPGNTAEKDNPANNPSLRGYEVIDEAKENIEAVCNGVVSCADILAFAARDSAQLAGEVSWEVRAGRRDGRISRASDIVGNLAPPTFNVNQLTQLFAKKGLTQEEMVTLSGAHTVGRSHCSSFSNRLYNFSSSSSQDPSLDPSYASQLRLRCPSGNADNTTVVPMETFTPTILDNFYYVSIRSNRGLFTSDQTLLSNPYTANLVMQNSEDGYLWKSRFSAAMAKMSEISVLTGTQGEIRMNCRAIN